jgi:hypothetical protein
MPAHVYNNMADSDADAIVAYLRSLPPIDNKIEIFAEHQTYPSQGLPEPGFGANAPDPADAEAYGEYLMNGVLICTDCHTPVDSETGNLNKELAFAGGQPFEGPWGIVYGGNITPHDETGTGTWSEGELRRAIMAGLRPDGRQLVLMPWEYFAGMQDPEITALTSYILNNLPAIDREVPGAALEEGFEQYIGGSPVATEAEEASNNNTTTIIIIAVVALVLVAGVFLWFFIGRSSNRG